MRMISETIVEKTFEFIDGKDISDWLEKVGNCKCTWNGNNLHIQGSINTAIYRKLDPVSIYVCISMALFGVFWVWVCGDGLKLLNKEWRRRLKEKKGKEKVENRKISQEDLFKGG